MTDETIDYDNVRLTFEGPLGILKLNAPQSLNAIGEAMATDMLLALNEVVKPRRRCRGLMLTGEGRAFSAGVNLMSRREAAREGKRTLEVVNGLETHYHPMLRRLHTLPIPVISAVNGLALGIGLGVAMTGDYIVAAESAWFQAPFRNLASAPDSGLTWLLPRAIGTTRARRMLLGAEKVDAKTALDWGLISEVVADDCFAERAKEVALSYANGATLALGEIKALINDGLRSDLNTIFEAEAVAVMRTARTKDNLAAVKLFASKDRPVFTGE
ncbi:MAG: enoyl-CoA hydratase/isomerase family protein [Sphingomonadaceae bacterium]|nr:enoyl-CoA hydratase/isomerase family protein [Sphingomonadaceae bacterium]